MLIQHWKFWQFFFGFVSKIFMSYQGAEEFKLERKKKWNSTLNTVLKPGLQQGIRKVILCILPVAIE